ncbi:MAG: DNA cytosine methyltransferase [Deltaproteobacteria bacterium]|jgi:DNA (cytosine-5)-methyltransferase 1|nr:DNA cytosine methyltransferase [Deltaproteobacteria bacterium]
MAARKLRFIDLFAGAGGLSEGLREAGYAALYANELEPEYARTYRRNHPGTPVETADIRTIDAARIRSELGLKRGELDLLAGGPPCQGFSINAPVRSVSDSRNHLFRDFLRFAEEFSPRAVLIENVPGLVSFSGGATLRAILDSLGSLGYRSDVAVLCAPWYRLSQTRWRTFVLGLKGGEAPGPAFPEPGLSCPARPNFACSFEGRPILKLPGPKAVPGRVTVREAIGDLPPLSNGERGAPVKGYASAPLNAYQERARAGSSGVLNHEAPRLSKINMERMALVAPGGNWKDIPDYLLPLGMRRASRSDHTKRYGRVEPDGLASTVLTKCDPHWGAYFHYDQERVFTVREAARIQSFPDRFAFGGTQTRQFAQVGNAVPPLLAMAVGVALEKSLK